MVLEVGEEVARVAGCAVDAFFGRAEKEQGASLLLFGERGVIPDQVAVPGCVGENKASLERGDGLGQPAHSDGRGLLRPEDGGELLLVGGDSVQPGQEGAADGLGREAAQGGAGHLVHAGGREEGLHRQGVRHAQPVDLLLQGAHGAISGAIHPAIPELDGEKSRVDDCGRVAGHELTGKGVGNPVAGVVADGLEATGCTGLGTQGHPFCEVSLRPQPVPARADGQHPGVGHGKAGMVAGRAGDILVTGEDGIKKKRLAKAGQGRVGFSALHPWVGLKPLAGEHLRQGRVQIRKAGRRAGRGRRAQGNVLRLCCAFLLAEGHPQDASGEDLADVEAAIPSRQHRTGVVQLREHRLQGPVGQDAAETPCFGLVALPGETTGVFGEACELQQPEGSV